MECRVICRAVWPHFPPPPLAGYKRQAMVHALHYLHLRDMRDIRRACFPRADVCNDIRLILIRSGRADYGQTAAWFGLLQMEAIGPAIGLRSVSFE